MAPRYHFRAITHKSHGVNTPTHLAPALASDRVNEYHKGVIGYAKSAGTLKHQLSKALSKNLKRRQNPFIFTTTSFLYALQHAIDKDSKGEKNVIIICIDTWTAERTDGENPRFPPAVSLGKELGMPDIYAHWTEEVRDFSDVYVATDDFKSGRGSVSVSLDRLKRQGLFNLYPELGIISTYPPTQVGLEAPVSDLRELWFTGCLWSSRWTWLSAYSVTATAGALQHVASDEHHIPEMEAFVQIYNRIASRQVLANRLTNLIVSVSPQILKSERDAYIELHTTNCAKRDAKAKEVRKKRNAASLRRKMDAAATEKEETKGQEEENKISEPSSKRRKVERER